MKNIYYKVMGVLLILFVGTLLVACKKDSVDPNDPNNIPDKLVVWMGKYWAGEGEAYLREMADRYEEQNEHGIKVEIVLQQDINTKLRSAIRSNEQVDVVIWDRWETSEFAKADYFLPMNDYIKNNDINVDDYFSEALGEMKIDDTIYGLPLQLDPHGIFVNTNAVDTLPSTWTELKQAAIEATLRNGTSYQRVGLHLDLAGYFSSFIQTAGGQMLSGPNKAGFNTAEGYSVLKYWDSLFDANIYTPGAVSGDNFTANDPFLNGKIAMRVDSLLNANAYYSKHKPTGFEYEFIPFPKGPDTGANANTMGGGLLGGYGLTMFSTTKYAYHSFELINWWVGSDEGVMNWHDISNQIPARITALNDPIYRAKLMETKNIANIIDELVNYKARPDANGYTSVENAILTPKIKALLEQGLYDHYADPIQAALDDMEKSANSRFSFGL